MKKTIQFFSFAMILLSTFAFTPAENLETSEVVSESSSLMICTGEFGAQANCLVSFQNPPTITLTNVFTGQTFSSIANGNAQNVTLPNGFYIVTLSSPVPCFMEAKWSFCGAEDGVAQNITGPTIVGGFLVN